MNRKKILAEIIFFILVMSLTMYSLFKDRGINDFARSVGEASHGMLCIALVLLMAYILLESVIIKLIMYSLGEDVSLSRCCKYSFIGFFFYCISPAGSLEQPAQLYVMHKDGIGASQSVYALAVITVTFKLSLVVLGAGVYVVRPPAVIRAAAPFESLCLLGMGLSLVVVLVLTGALCIPEIVKRGTLGVIGILNRIGIIRKTDRWCARLDGFFEKYDETLRIGGRHPLMLLSIFIITMIQKVCFLAITADGCYSLGVVGDGAVDIIAIQEMIQLATEMMPVPGGMGLSEMLYLKAFTSMFGERTFSALIMSRGVGYYLQLIICGVVSAGFYISAWLKERKKL